MHLRHVVALPLVVALGCHERPPAAGEAQSRVIELACGQSGSQHIGPLDIHLPPFHTVVGVVDLLQPGHEDLLAWVRIQAGVDLHFSCPAGTLSTAYADESAYADGLVCNATYEGIVTGSCTCGTPMEDCSNGLDDDGDGRVDCEDSDCTWMAHCAPPPWRCTAEDACESDGRVLGDSDPACADPRKLSICALDAWCCTYEWDASCAARAAGLGFCDEDHPDAGPIGPDAGPIGEDAGPIGLDAGVIHMDAGTLPDAWMPPPPFDAGTLPIPDAWMPPPPPDAGPMPDAWMPPPPPDAGPMPDAWMPPPPPDAGPMPDAWMPPPPFDAGMPPPPFDAGRTTLPTSGGTTLRGHGSAR